jgi:hypothetical protein
MRTERAGTGLYYLVILNRPTRERHRQRSVLRIRLEDFETS